MNPASRLRNFRSSPLYRTFVVFVSGVVLGALMMVEIVPASSLVEIQDVGSSGAGPTAVGQASEGTDGDTSGGTDTGDTTTTTDGTGTTTGTAGTTGTTGTTGTSGTSGTSGTGTSTGAATSGTTTGDSEIACAPGRNGGATDQGVTATEIQMATTVVESGIGSAFLGEVRHGMQAVVNRVNREGGICGRQLKVTYRDDGWKPETGAQFLRNFIAEGIFAVPIGPSSEGLNVVIDAGDFDKAQIPVVGTDGLIIKQYERKDGSAQPWVWPVAVATVSSARIMAKDAFDRGARNFSIVFDWNYRFGAEGAEAFNAEVKRLTGSDIAGYEPGSTSCNLSFCGVASGQSSYSGQVQSFRGNEGDFVALFLEPDTALKWMTDKNAPSAKDPAIPYGFGGAQPLFTKAFAEGCKQQCHGMMVWTGFKPFQEQYRSDPEVQAYVTDLQTTNRNADENNQFTLGAYIGMELLVEGIKAVGPELTRQKLQQVLNTIEFDSGLALADPLTFSPDNRYVATAMQRWEVQYAGTFAGWRPQAVVTDPKFGG